MRAVLHVAQVGKAFQSFSVNWLLSYVNLYAPPSLHPYPSAIQVAKQEEDSPCPIKEREGQSSQTQPCPRWRKETILVPNSLWRWGTIVWGSVNSATLSTSDLKPTPALGLWWSLCLRWKGISHVKDKMDQFSRELKILTRTSGAFTPHVVGPDCGTSWLWLATRMMCNLERILRTEGEET